MGDVSLDFFEAQRFSLGIQPDLYFREIQIERACDKPLGSQFGCELPGDVKFSADLIDRRTLSRASASLYVSRAALRMSVLAKRTKWTFPLRLTVAKTEKVR